MIQSLNMAGENYPDSNIITDFMDSGFKKQKRNSNDGPSLDHPDDYYRNWNISQDLSLTANVKVTGKMDQNNTLANLLMYESEYVPKPPIDNASTSDLYPTYYEENTPNQDQSGYSEESEDMLYNFLLKLLNALAYRIRVIQRDCFQAILSHRSPNSAPNRKDLFEISLEPQEPQSDHLIRGTLNPIQEQSESSESKRQSVITFFVGQQSQQRMSSQPVGPFSFNPSLKRKQKEHSPTQSKPSLKVFLALPSIKNADLLSKKEKGFAQAVANPLKNDEGKMKLIILKPDEIQDEVIEEINEQYFENTFPSFQSGSPSAHGSSDPQDSRQLRRELLQNQSYENDQGSKNSQRPLSYFVENPHNNYGRPMSYFNSPLGSEINPVRNNSRDPSLVWNRPISNITNQYNNNLNNRKVVITYGQSPPPRAKSEGPRILSRPLTSQVPEPKNQIIRSPQNNFAQINIVRSQYYANQNRQHFVADRPYPQHKSPQHSVRSAPHSPVIFRGNPMKVTVQSGSGQGSRYPPMIPKIQKTVSPPMSDRITDSSHAQNFRINHSSPTSPRISFQASQKPRIAVPDNFRKRVEGKKNQQKQIHPMHRQFRDSEYFDLGRSQNKKKLNVVSKRGNKNY